MEAELSHEWNRVHFSTVSEDWETPQDTFDWAYRKFGPLTLDVCASRENTKLDNYFTKADNALVQKWAPSRCWMNPPYGRQVGKWIQKAYLESKEGAIVVCLLPARTDTRWFHDYCIRGEIWFLKGRLKFGGSKNSAPFPSMVVVFGRMA